VEIALLDWGGDGPVILAHHANGFCAGMWGEVAEALSGRFRLVAMDARGHGDSSKPESPRAYAWDRFVDDVVAVAETLASEAPDGTLGVGAGHSFGGAATLMAAARRPELFASVLLLDPVIMDPEMLKLVGKRRHSGGMLAAVTRRRRRMWASRDEAVELWVKHAFFKDWTPRARALYAEFGLADRLDGQVELKCPPEVEATIFEYGGSLEPLPVAHRISAPTLFVHAARGTFEEHVYADVAARMPRARVESLDVGHLMLMEQPAVVVDALLRVASETQDSTG
jgi:pimeloyl-ACP methyl ester carboxylesterase